MARCAAQLKLVIAVAQPTSGPCPTASLHRKPLRDLSEVTVGIVLDAILTSKEPPPVRKTAPAGKPLAVPLKPKPLRPPAANAGWSGWVGALPSLQPSN